MGKKAAAVEGHVSGQANKPMSLPAHSLSLKQVVDELRTEEWSGLDDAEAKRRVDDYGTNELGEAESVSPVKILAMAVSFGIGSWIEGGVVAFVVGLNVVVGFFQEWSAEKTMDSLRSLSSPTARVIRGGQQVTVPSAEVVPGDVIEVKVGDTLPADIRSVRSLGFPTSTFRVHHELADRAPICLTNPFGRH
jgi:Na+-exporting ATPase